MLSLSHKLVSAIALVFTLIALLVAFAASSSSVTHADGPLPGFPPEDPARGLVYRGLEVDSTGLCTNLYRVVGTSICTHGPDPAPLGSNVQNPVSTVPNVPTPLERDIVCDGDGTSGNRVQAIYAVAPGKTNRYSTVVATIRSRAADADAIFQASAQETGGSRHIRFVTDSSCAISVLNVTLQTSSGDDNYSNTVQELQALGYNASNRKYAVFVDNNIYCGIGSLWDNDSVSSSNPNNFGSSYATVHTGCWLDSGTDGQPIAHELMHNLGGVQHSAPHSTNRQNSSDGNTWHCADESDRMCYVDASGVTMTQVCVSSHDRLFDCNHDDYYSTNPGASTYLATHWNTANNQFLIAGTALGVPSLISPASSAVLATRTPAFDWSDVSGATSYRLRVRQGSTTGTLVVSVSPSASTYATTTSLATGVYYWRVAACNSGGCGAFTTWRSFTLQ